MPQEYPTRNLALIVNSETDDQQRQIATGETAVDGDGHTIVTTVAAAADPTTGDIRPAGHLWLNTTTQGLFYSYGGGNWIRINVAPQGWWYNSAAQAITTTISTIPLNTAAFNNAADHWSLAAGQLTILKAGDYEVEYQLNWTASGANSRVRAELQRNGTPLAGFTSLGWGGASGYGFTMARSGILSLALNDVLRIQGVVTGGAGSSALAQGNSLRLRRLR